MIEQLDWRLVIFGALCLVTVIQVVYYLYFFRRLAFYRLSPEGLYHQQPVSVVICARDEAANLAKNLPGVLVQEYVDKHELILVNDNSIDETKYQTPSTICRGPAHLIFSWHYTILHPG